MSRKISIGAALALALLLVAASIPLTMIYAQRMFNGVIGDAPARSGENQAIEEIRKIVSKNFFAGLDRDMMTAGMVRGYIAGLGDEQSRYLSATEYTAYLQRLEGAAPDLGLELDYEPGGTEPDTEGETTEAAEAKAGALVIAHVKSGSPAAASGLLRGDHILKVQADNKVIFDEKDLKADNAGEIIKKLGDLATISANTPSSALTITYRRGAEVKSVSVMIGSAVSSLSWEIMDSWSKDGKSGEPTVGYIKIFNFYKNTAEQLETAIRSLGDKGAYTYIIDLRGCSEGTLEDACKALNPLVPVSQGSAMATVTYKDGKKDTYPSDSNNSLFLYTSGGMAVLINGSTSGVAELFAYNLRAYHNEVLLVGQKTKGISTIQKAIPLERVGGAALLSMGRVEPYHGGADWNADGVQPNEMENGVELNVKDKDMQLRNAIEALTK